MNEKVRVLTDKGVVTSKRTAMLVRELTAAGWEVEIVDCSKKKYGGLTIDKMWLDEEIILDNKKS